MGLPRQLHGLAAGDGASNRLHPDRRVLDEDPEQLVEECPVSTDVVERPEEWQQRQPLHDLDGGRETFAENVRQHRGGQRQRETGHEPVESTAEHERPCEGDRCAESRRPVPEESGIRGGQEGVDRREGDLDDPGGSRVDTGRMETRDPDDDHLVDIFLEHLGPLAQGEEQAFSGGADGHVELQGEMAVTRVHDADRHRGPTGQAQG